MREVDVVVDRVFADPELGELLVAPPASPAGASLADVIDWFRGVIQAYFAWVDWLLGMRETAPVTYWLILIGMVVVLVLLIWHLAYSLRAALSSADPGAPRSALKTERARRESYQEARARAAELARAGDTRAAVRMLVLSLLTLLEARKALRVARGWTTREILGRLGQKLGGRADVGGVVTTVEVATYGPVPIDHDEFERLDARVGEIADTLLAVEVRK